MKFKDMKMTDYKSINVLIYFKDITKPIGGSLVYDNNSITLSFVSEEISFENLDQKQSIESLGILTHEGEHITLINGIILTHKTHTANISAYKYHFQYLIITKSNYQVCPRETMFSGFKLNCTYFKEILKRSPFSIGARDEDGFPKFIETNLTSALGFSIIQNPQIQVTDSYTAKSTLFNEEGDLVLKSTPFINIKYFSKLKFEDMIKEVNNLKNLFSFLMDMRILVEELFLKNNEEQFKVLWSNESGIRVSKKRVSLIAEAKELIRNSLPTIITNYYKTDIFQDIFETYVNNMYKAIYVEDFLLSQITLIEGLDTRFRDKKQTNLKTRVEKFFENFCEDEIEKINNQFGSEMQLNQDLVNYLHKFRNYHSHLYELERKPETQLDIYTISLFLRELIKIYMLSKLTNQSLLKTI